MKTKFIGGPLDGVEEDPYKIDNLYVNKDYLDYYGQSIWDDQLTDCHRYDWYDYLDLAIHSSLDLKSWRFDSKVPSKETERHLPVEQRVAKLKFADVLVAMDFPRVVRFHGFVDLPTASDGRPEFGPPDDGKWLTYHQEFHYVISRQE